MRALLIAAATVGVLLTAPAMAAPASAPAPQTQAATDQATVQDFSARRHHRWWRHRHHRHHRRRHSAPMNRTLPSPAAAGEG